MEGMYPKSGKKEIKEEMQIKDQLQRGETHPRGSG